MTPIVQAENLSRFYGLFLGLNNVTFTIQPGITGVVGPNGAGKTTLFRLLTGQIQPDSGTLTVFGSSPAKDPAVRARLAYCPESEMVPVGLRPLEWLVALAMISGLPASAAKARSISCLERVKLASEHWGKRLTSLSKGMKQRVKLAQCLLHQPDLIILDEPMNGLDPMGREDFTTVLRELAEAGVSIIISSHILQDLEALCGDFILLRWGRIARPDNGPAATNRRPESTTFRCDSPEALARFLFDRKLLRGFEIVAEQELRVHWSVPEKFYADFSDLLLASGVRIFEVRSTVSFLENAIEKVST